MENQKVYNYTSESARIQTPSFLQKMIIAVQNLFSANTVSAEKLIPVRSSYNQEANTGLRHAALLNMLNHGKNYDDANLILDEAEDWELDYDLLNPSKIAVHGKSVWIDAQD
jgi:hypothetical protein